MKFKRAACALLAAWMATNAHASVDGKSKTVLARYLKASGGQTAWERDSTVHARMHIKAFGLEGSVDRWTARPDRSLTATRIGPLSLSEGTGHGRAWRIDQNGKLQWLDGNELADALGSSYLDQEMWLAPDQGGGSVRYLRQEGKGPDQVDVLEVTPPKGRARQLFFSARTGYLVKLVQPGDAQTVATTLSDYADIDGRPRAQRSLASVEGMPANNVDASLDSLRSAVQVDESMFLPPEATGKDFRILGEGTSVTMPMRYSERHVWLKVSVNGAAPEDFLLDTGASVTVLDSALAAKLGLATSGSLQGSGAGSAGQFSFTQIQTMRVGDPGKGIELNGQNVVVAPLSRFLAAYFWRDTPGVLGYDFLSRFVTAIDYERQTLTFTDPERFTYTGSGKAIAMTFSEGVPVVRAKLDNQYEGDFRLDVGSGSSVDLHTPFVEKNGIRDKVKKTVESPGAGFGGSFSMDMARMSQFSIGPYAVPDPLVGLSRASTGTFSGQDFAGNVGNRILDRFRATFDYSRKTVYLEPNSRFGTRESFGKFGAQLMKEGNDVTVGFIQGGTPAAQAGLRSGDIVRTINGKPAASYSIDSLFPLFEDSPDGLEIKLGIERQGSVQEIKVKLEAIL